MNLLYSNIKKVLFIFFIFPFFKTYAIDLAVYIEKPKYENNIPFVLKKIIKDALDDAINEFTRSDCAIKKSVVLYRDTNKYKGYEDFMEKKGEGIYLETIAKDYKNLNITLYFIYGKISHVMTKEDNFNILRKNDLPYVKKKIQERIFYNLNRILKCN